MAVDVQIPVCSLIVANTASVNCDDANEADERQHPCATRNRKEADCAWACQRLTNDKASQDVDHQDDRQ